MNWYHAETTRVMEVFLWVEEAVEGVETPARASQKATIDSIIRVSLGVGNR